MQRGGLICLEGPGVIIDSPASTQAVSPNKLHGQGFIKGVETSSCHLCDKIIHANYLVSLRMLGCNNSFPLSDPVTSFIFAIDTAARAGMYSQCAVKLITIYLE